MLEQLHCMMYSYTSDMVFENLGRDEEEGGGRGDMLSLSVSPSFPPSHLCIWQNFGQLQGV